MLNKFGLQEFGRTICRERALELIREVRNTRETIFAPDHWLDPRLDQLRVLLSDPLTPDQSQVLLTAILKGCSLNDVIAWLAEGSNGWSSFITEKRWLETTRKEQERERGREQVRQMVEAEKRKLQESGCATFWEAAKNDKAFQASHQERVPQAQDKYFAKAKSCPRCGTPPPRLEWFYYCSPASTWQRMMGRAGWMTYCGKCGMRIDFFVEVLN